jgi:hypothetical protein
LILLGYEEILRNPLYIVDIPEFVPLVYGQGVTLIADVGCVSSAAGLLLRLILPAYPAVMPSPFLLPHAVAILLPV